MRRGRPSVALALALVLLACGSDGDRQSAPRGGESEASLAPLLDRVPAAANVIKAMDLAGARRQLGVAADLDPARYGRRQSSGTPEERFDLAALQLMDYLYFGDSPFTRAIDHGRLSSAVNATLIPGGDLTILKTAQPREQIERGLQRAGLRRHGAGGYVVDGEEPAYGLAAAAVGDGLVVLARTIDIATGALRRRDPDPGSAPARRLLDETRGALRAVHTYRTDSSGPESACVLGVAGGRRFGSGGQGEDVALRLAGEPRASEVTLGRGAQRRDPATKPYVVTDIARSGQVLRLTVRAAPNPRDQANAVAIAIGGVRPYHVYRCPGAAAERARRKLDASRTVLPPSPEPDRTGSRLETVISNYLAALSTAPNAVRVRCPVQTLPRGTRTLRCTGTRRHKRRLYHYTMTVAYKPDGPIEYIDIDSPDDGTGTIVSKPGKAGE